MNAKGQLTGWTAVLILAGVGMAIAGAVLAPNTLPAWLLGGGFIATYLALGNIYRPVRRAVREREIREDERTRLSHRTPS